MFLFLIILYYNITKRPLNRKTILTGNPRSAYDDGRRRVATQKNDAHWLSIIEISIEKSFESFSKIRAIISNKEDIMAKESSGVFQLFGQIVFCFYSGLFFLYSDGVFPIYCLNILVK